MKNTYFQQKKKIKPLCTTFCCVFITEVPLYIFSYLQLWTISLPPLAITFKPLLTFFTKIVLILSLVPLALNPGATLLQPYTTCCILVREFNMICHISEHHYSRVHYQSKTLRSQVAEIIKNKVNPSTLIIRKAGN